MLYDTLTSKQQHDVAALAVLLDMDQHEEIMDSDGVTVADVVRLSKNKIWLRGGCEEVRLIERAVDEFMENNRDQPGLDL